MRPQRLYRVGSIQREGGPILPHRWQSMSDTVCRGQQMCPNLDSPVVAGLSL